MNCLPGCRAGKLCCCERRLLMRQTDPVKPGYFYSKNLWNLYLFLNSLEKLYIYAGWDDKSQLGEEMYYFEDMTLGGEETLYAHYSIGDIPCSKMEWITFKLLNIKSGHLNRIVHTIKTEALYEQEKSIEEMLRKYRIRIPSKEELKKRYFLDIESPDGGSGMKIPLYF